MVFGIASQEPEDDVRRYIEQLGVTYPILIDTNGTVHSNYQQNEAFRSGVYPQDWIIGPDSTIVYRNNGYELDAMLTVLNGSGQ